MANGTCPFTSGVAACLTCLLWVLAAGGALACGGGGGKTWDIGGAMEPTISQPAQWQKFAPSAEVACSGSASDSDHWVQGENSGNQGDTFNNSEAYNWSASQGTWKNDDHTGQNVTWIAPAAPGIYTIFLTADDDGALPQGDYGNRNDGTLITSVTVLVCTHAHPTNFHEDVAARYKQSGNLFFRYLWESDSGNLSDLAGTYVGEYLDWAGCSNPVMFPDPPFDSWAGQENPYDSDPGAAGTDGSFGDGIFRGGGFSTRYSAQTFLTLQRFWFHCNTCMSAG